MVEKNKKINKNAKSIYFLLSIELVYSSIWFLKKFVKLLNILGILPLDVWIEQFELIR